MMGRLPIDADWVATRGALPRFRLRQTYGATSSEADRVGNRLKNCAA
jgi:hypothetical protein